MNQKTIIFDFDGTLADSLDLLLSIYNTIAPTYKAQSVTKADIDMLRSAKDPKQLLKTFRIRFFVLPSLIQAIRKQFKDQLNTVELHPGIYEMITTLANKGYTIGALSSNSTDSVTAVLAANNIQQHFSFIHSNDKLLKKHSNLKKIIHKHALDRNKTIYVGDESRDMVAAKKANITGIGVSWGFQTVDALSTSGAKHIATTPQELVTICEECISSHI